MKPKHLLSLLLCAAAVGQQPEAPAPDKAQQGRELADSVFAQFQKQGIAIDLKKGTVTVPCFVNAPPEPVEYLLIHKKGKKHEAMFFTESKPSVLNAALLMLGLVPGKNAAYKEKDPPPSLEEIEQGADPIVITPPSGMEFWITVRWQDDVGKAVEHCVEDLIADLVAQAPVREASFIFLGGRMAALYRGEPEVFVADFEGNLISLCYLSPDNHLATMRHERARDDENWWMTEKVPAAGVKVDFVFHKQKSALHAERERRLRAQDEAAKEAPPVEGGEPRKDGQPKEDDQPAKDGV